MRRTTVPLALLVAAGALGCCAWRWTSARTASSATLPAAAATGRAGVDSLYPDPALTPGVVETTDPFACPVARHVTDATKRQVFTRYHLPYPEPQGAYEVDHFIPLELGGSNAIEILWPEPASPPPGFHEKDDVENWLHGQVRAGKTALPEAQDRVHADWYRVYLDMRH